MGKTETLKSSVEELREYFLAQLTILRGLSKMKLVGRAYEVRVILLSACSTGSAIHQLGDKPEYFYSEMMMLSRSLIEKLTNFCYLQVCEETDFERYLLYPYYRAFHNSDRKKYTPKGKMQIVYTGKDEMQKDTQVARALDLFSETNPRMSWSSLNIDQKIAFLANNTQLRTEFFLMNTLTIYSNASEALHGSLFGCVLATGAYTPNINHGNRQNVLEHLFKNTALLYVQLGSIIHEITNSLSLENVSLLEQSKENEKRALKIMESIFDKNESQTK